MPHSMCGSGARWCVRADAILDVPDMHVLDVQIDDQQRLVLTIESGQLEAAWTKTADDILDRINRKRISTPDH